MLSTRIIEEIDKLEPYGIGNPKPLLVASRVRIVGEPRVVGDRKNHLQLRVAQGGAIVKAIAWNMADRGRKLSADTLCSLAFHPEINEWNGRREVQLHIKDFQLDEAGDHDPAPLQPV
jgi:single-stranded-DNA-specific exonuclease